MPGDGWLLQRMRSNRESLRNALPPSFRTIHDLIDHYIRIGDARPNHSDPEHYRLRTLSRHLGNIPVSDLRGSDLARFRDERLQVIQPTTLAREIYLLRRIIRLAREEWDVDITDNPLDRFWIPDKRLTRERRASQIPTIIILNHYQRWSTS
jgi:hypothetical protein